MFAVKGWNVDASQLKPQTEVIIDRNIQNGEEKLSRKRKREVNAVAQADNVEKLWEQHIEGKEPAKKKKKSQKLSKQEKRQRKLGAEQSNKPSDVLVDAQAEKSQQVELGTGAHAGLSAEKKLSKKERLDREIKSGAQDSTKGPGARSEAQQDAAAQEEKSSKKSKKDKNSGKDTKQQKAGSDVTAASGRASTALTKTAKSVPPVMSSSPAGAKLTPMQAAMRQKLISARFRHLNEKLYTEPSAAAVELFDANPEMFEDYHSGFRQQVAVWPENPVDNFIATIRERGSVALPSQKKMFKDKKRHSNPAPAPEVTSDSKVPTLPRTHGTAIIADLGCGDARLAQTLKDSGDGQKLQIKVLSYDLHSPSKLVTKADISNIPTADGSVDIAIFCLALMGTNWISFIEEAYRILHWKGELWIAEIKSRFGRVGRAGKPVEHSVGGKRKQAAIKKAQDAKKRDAEETNEQETLAVQVDGVETQTAETDVSAFVEVLKRRGFVLKNGESSIDLGNKMFVKMEFLKAAAPTKGKNVQERSAPKPTERFKKPKAKFLDEEKDEVATDDEAKVLKPCLYKIR